ncbi:MAG: hypothetical protein M3Z04_24455 [Chloroflexota bacterium]|nr:hypothetical protein [Chloroflexota bacterium]
MKYRVLGSIGTVAAVAVSALSIVGVGAQQAPLFAHPAFESVWNRTDSLVLEGRVPRSWYWGPQPNTPGIYEKLSDGPDGTGRRLVQYFDKSRMELNNPNGDATSPFYVTNGLLTVELIGGCIQTSTTAACGEARYPAYIPMTGDNGDALAPTYAAFGKVANSRFGDHPAGDARGQQVTATIDRDGNVGNDAAKGQVPLTRVVYYEATTKHNIPEAFWSFLNQTGDVREQGRIVNAPISSPWFYVTGLPISEAYWTKATIRGQVTDVLVQAFERRVLTYTPTNVAAFQVEMGNIGQHYYNWRYGFQGQPAPGTGTPYLTPVNAGTPTFAPTQVPGSQTAVPSGTPGLATAPVPSRTTTAVPSGTVTAVPSLTPSLSNGTVTAVPSGTTTTDPTVTVTTSPQPSATP